MSVHISPQPLTLKQIQYAHGKPMIQFTKGERQVFTQEEGLHQVVIIKFFSDTLEIHSANDKSTWRLCGCSIQIEQHLYRVFPWTIDFNSGGETSNVVMWILLPQLSPNLFAKKSLLSMASTVGRPIDIDKATQDKISTRQDKA
ncbi:hypothetical protein H5410_014217 [Solanum commersonii]|uniref:DUF4283 domain-containing protein n=1 Tax=Solanum commersonii TaxID=4109 RepID=A0A9J5ZQB2_SOLCO|nr:hypothetical protein H5410_014217 [Solanum commersonii]